ncbi:3-isopropylmalate dehydratase small subunit [Candidatus Nitrosocosmicus arcticus]|uniref:3-isopropylmalate dehydratase n=1 Tax=Candidatus Nitrosocosmicus arcticus TaxID=2035267 RepID=A0A557SSV7_9ARCH|nr:3-isopropylmalate dehydratase small subunit [Candidatus Nitrosocosmicus arcticus]TVP39693.1 3-isopropylmalate dehydratase small subunit [Candidatus Nitrosocosmicus arcticus]
MEPFKNLTSKVVPLDIANIDTDQIIPKQFLKLLGKTGYGEYLFFNWRYDNQGIPLEDFVLNSPLFSGRQILLTRENFGIGSSREHAVWALKDYGFKVILGVSFADIFYNNCSKNGVLVIKMDKNTIEDFFSSKINENFEIDLIQQQIKINSEVFGFDVDPTLKNYLVNGLDEISKTLELGNHIKKYEDKNKVSVEYESMI